VWLAGHINRFVLLLGPGYGRTFLKLFSILGLQVSVRILLQFTGISSLISFRRRRILFLMFDFPSWGGMLYEDGFSLARFLMSPSTKGQPNGIHLYFPPLFTRVYFLGGWGFGAREKHVFSFLPQVIPTFWRVCVGWTNLFSFRLECFFPIP